jgi:polyhydroxybutyrate depolymerase
MNRGLPYGLFGLFISIVFLNACTGALPPSPINGPATYHQRMDLFTGAFQRSYSVHIPSGYDGITAMPLVVVIHGAFDTARGIEKFSGFSRLADREHFIVLYFDVAELIRQFFKRCPRNRNLP